MWNVAIHFAMSGKMYEYAFAPETPGEEGVKLTFSVGSHISRRKALIEIAKNLERNNVTWLRPIVAPEKDWILDLDELRRRYKNLQRFDWLYGKAKVTPEHEIEEKRDSDKSREEAMVRFMVTRQEAESIMKSIYVSELEPFIECFRMDYSESECCAFIMMRFKKTPLHQEIVGVVRDVCSKHGITALRADDKQYADDLLANVRTYMHGCRFGIAIFERLTEDEFNPDVSLEVGYMMALGKPVCFLKDKTLPFLQTDLAGRLYEPFDVQNPRESIPGRLEKWLRDKNFIR